MVQKTYVCKHRILNLVNNFVFHAFIDSKPSEKLSSLLTNTQLCKDVRRLSPVYQTSSLEAFHSVIIHFTPKYVAFSYHGMNCRYITSLDLIIITEAFSSSFTIGQNDNIIMSFL